MTIQELAQKARKEGLQSGDRLTRLMTDKYRTAAINATLDGISSIPLEYSFDDLRFFRAWDEPPRLEWNRIDLWKWFTSDGKNLEFVGKALLSQQANGNKPTLLECIEDALWEESWEVFNAVKAYLIEECTRKEH